MKKNILVFGASNSKQSINARFAWFAANQLENIKTTFVDLNDFELPLYSVDLERESGIPENAVRFAELIKECDGVVASFAEHNGLFTSAFKNLWDWMSRINSANIWRDKPMFFLSASVSRRKQNYVTKVGNELFPHYGAQIVSSFYLSSFNHTFKENQIIDPDLKTAFEAKLTQYQTFLNNL